MSDKDITVFSLFSQEDEDEEESTGDPPSAVFGKKRAQVTGFIKAAYRYFKNLFSTPAPSASHDILDTAAPLSVKLVYDINEGWLRPPPPIGSDKIGLWKPERFPNLKSAPVPLPRDNKYLDLIPLTFTDEFFESWLKGPALISGGAISLPHLAFNKGEVKIGKNTNFNRMDVLARKALLHNIAADSIQSNLLTVMSKLITDWDTSDNRSRFNRLKAMEKVMNLAFMSNTNSRLYILAMYVDNKVTLRNHVLDMTIGCEESKKTLRTTSFYTSSLFGPFPQSFQDRLESSFASRHRQSLQSSYCLTFLASPSPSNQSSRGSSRKGSGTSSKESRPRQEYTYPTASPESGDSLPRSPRGRGNFLSRGRGRRRGRGYKPR